MTAAPRDRRQRPVLALLAFAQLIISVDYTIVYVALPQIGTDLGFSPQDLQWVISAYAVGFGGALLLGGRACDLYGPRRMFVLGLSLYAVSSLAGGLAGTPGLLIAARAVQGVGGAFLFPATLTLVSTLFTAGAARNRAYSVWGAAGGSGLIVGALAGGLLTQVLGWRAVLYVNVPLAGIAAVAALGLVARDVADRSRRRIDLPGALTATVGVTALVFALVQGPASGWGSLPVLLSATLGGLLLAGFVTVEQRSRDPLMPLRLLRVRSLRTGMAVTFLFMATIGTLAYFLTVYFQDVLGYGALRTGLAFLVPMLAVTVGSLLGGRAATRFGMRTVMTGSLILSAAGAVLVGLMMTADSRYAVMVPGFLVLGLGQGAGYTVMFGASSSGVAGREQGIAAGMASTAQQIGGAMGLAVLVAVANSAEQGFTSRAATLEGLRAALLAAGVGVAVAALVSLRFPRGAGDEPEVSVIRDAASAPRRGGVASSSGVSGGPSDVPGEPAPSRSAGSGSAR